MIKQFIVLCLLSLLPLSKSLQAKEEQVHFTIGWYFPSINATVSRTDFQVALDFWAQEISRSQDIGITEARLFDHIEELKAAFNKGELSFIVAPPLLFVQYFDLQTLKDGFVGTSVTGSPYAMTILARTDKQIHSVKDVQHTRLILPENDILAEVFLNTLLIPEFAQGHNKVFNSISYQQKHQSIILDLFFDKADVGVAYLETFELMAELNPQIKKSIAVLAQFPIESPNYGYFHNQFPEEKREMLLQAIFKLNDSLRLQQILNNFNMATLVRCPVSSLQPFVDLNNRYRLLQQQFTP